MAPQNQKQSAGLARRIPTAGATLAVAHSVPVLRRLRTPAVPASVPNPPEAGLSVGNLLRPPGIAPAAKHPSAVTGVSWPRSSVPDRG